MHYRGVRLILLAMICALLLGGYRVASGHATAPAAPTVAGDEFWDDRFGLPGVDGKVWSVAVAANGDLYVGGNFDEAGGAAAKNIARWDGRSWSALGAGVDGSFRPAYDLAINGNDVYVVGGLTKAGNVTADSIARWNGTAWSLVGNGTGPKIVDEYGTEEGSLETVAIYNNEVCVGGHFNRIDAVDANNVACWDGTQWHALDTGVGTLDFDGVTFDSTRSYVYELEVANGKLYVGGNFTLAGGNDAVSIAVWDGTTWSGFGSGLAVDDGFNPAGNVWAIAVSGTTVYAGGNFSMAGGTAVNNIARWDGTQWHALGSGVTKEFASVTDSLVKDLLLVGDTLYAAGDFAAAGSTLQPGIAQWNGTDWSDVGGGVVDDYPAVYALAAAPAGGIYVGGSFADAGAVPMHVHNITRWTGTAWVDFGKGANDGFDDPADVRAMAIDAGGRVYVGGGFKFSYAGGTPVGRLAMWDGAAWQNIGGTIDGDIEAIEVDGDNIYVGGRFTAIGGISANHVARWNRVTNTWSALGSGINGDVFALNYANGTLYVGGSFSAAGTATANNVAYWENNAWNALGGGFRIYEPNDQCGEAGTYVNAIAVDGDFVYIGGRFQTIHEIGTDPCNITAMPLVNNLVGWQRSTTTWFALGVRNATTEPGVTDGGYSGLGVDVNAIAVIGDNVYVTGGFNQAGAIAASNIARWNATTNTWSALGAGLTGGLQASLFRETAAFDMQARGTHLFVVGHFRNAGSVSARYVAQYDTATNTWSGLGSGVAWYNDKFTQVGAVAVGADGVYIGGKFSSAGPHSAYGFARWGTAIAGGNITPGAGGVVATQDGVKITVPAGAVTEDVNLTYVGLTAPTHTIPVPYRAITGFRLDGRTANGQTVTTTSKPFTIEIPYPVGMVQAATGADPTTLKVLMWNGTAWQTLTPTVNTTTHTVTVSATRFTEFALVEEVEQQLLYLPLVVR